MKKCSYCGKVYADTATVCDVDRQPLWNANPPHLPAATPIITPDEARQIIDNDHLKLLAIFHYVFAGLALLGFLFLCVHFLIMTAVLTNPQIWNSPRNSSGPPPQFFSLFLGGFYLLFGTAVIATAILNFLAARFLGHRKHRTFCFVVAGLNCLHIPFGTILGIFTIIVLSRESVRRQYPE